MITCYWGQGGVNKHDGLSDRASDHSPMLFSVVFIETLPWGAVRAGVSLSVGPGEPSGPESTCQWDQGSPQGRSQPVNGIRGALRAGVSLSMGSGEPSGPESCEVGGRIYTNPYMFGLTRPQQSQTPG